ncbi:CidA/LrgA family protein [Clostridium sp. MSJ-8]|uniref:CidA/LrgA family protein n=1 Tax=Clostridium sp. MSJ-8 TaxID=2841510 RepID=UPI001C0EC7C0|nr:CidA/LrgA family protein [Clostridium sp. MSJ-8]MBU5486949.1 CidA/LrgA family protein [Clostridium sp. MSJ-8]
MKKLKEFLIILAISFIGEVLHSVLPLPIPSSIYGLLVMLLVLCTGIVKVEQVDDAGTFLIDIMPVMFIPAAVGLLESWGTLKSMLVACIITATISTAIVMGVAGKVTEFIIKKRKSE